MKTYLDTQSRVKFNLTDDQIQLMNILLVHGWEIKTRIHDLIKGKLSFEKKDIKVIFDYIDIRVIDNNIGNELFIFYDIGDISNEQLELLLS